MRLVEVIRSDTMEDAAYDRLFEFGESLGKVAVKCKDTPG
jgi:3-hydroxyacyl-CoA dehydrogenase